MKTKYKRQTTISPEFDFFLHDSLSQYEGKYVAIIGKRVVSYGSSAKEVWDTARKKYPRSLPTIAKIPRQEIFAFL